MSMNDNNRVRSRIRKARDRLPEAYRLSASDAVCRRIADLDAYRRADVIFSYSPLGSEVSVTPLICQALREGKRIAYPRVTGPGQMEFYFIRDPDSLRTGSFGIREPSGEETAAHPAQADLILVPGTVFSEDCVRMGYGGGYYDRYLPRCRGFRVMPAFLMQKSAFEALAHDAVMDRIVTEDGIFCRIRED